MCIKGWNLYLCSLCEDITGFTALRYRGMIRILDEESIIYGVLEFDFHLVIGIALFLGDIGTVL